MLGAGLDHDAALDARARRRPCRRSAARSSRARGGCTRAAGPSCRCRSTSPRGSRGARGGRGRSSHWMASVISSSPRADGSIARDRVVDRRDRRGRRRRARGRTAGRAGFSIELHDLAVGVEHGDAELPRVVDVREQDLRRRATRPSSPGSRARARPRSASTNSFEPLLQHVVAEVHDEVVVAEEVAGDEHAVREAERRVLAGCR